MNLFKINQQIMDCAEIDPETGEIVNIEEIEALQMDFAEKAENVACWIKNLEAEIKALDEQEKTFKARKKADEKKVESLKQYLSGALDGQKFSTERCVVSFRRTNKVNVLDESIIPAEYMTEKVTKEPNKTAIGAAIKSGMDIPGCELVKSLSMSVK